MRAPDQRQTTTRFARATVPRAPAAPAACMFLNPDTIAAACGLSAAELALLAGLSPDSGEQEPWHPQLQSLLRELVDLFALVKAASPHQAGAAFWAAHRAVPALGGRTLVEAIADGDRAAVEAHLRPMQEPRRTMATANRHA